MLIPHQILKNPKGEAGATGARDSRHAAAQQESASWATTKYSVHRGLLSQLGTCFAEQTGPMAADGMTTVSTLILLFSGAASATETQCNMVTSATAVNSACCVLEGGEIDGSGHGCAVDGGYEWCAAVKKCVRPWTAPPECKGSRRALQASPCNLPDTCPNKKCAAAMKSIFDSCTKEMHKFDLYNAMDGLRWDCDHAFPASSTQKVPTWRLGGEGQTCDDVCKKHSQQCTEEMWPGTKEHLATVVKRFKLDCPHLEENTWAGAPSRSMQPMTGDYLCYVAA